MKSLRLHPGRSARKTDPFRAAFTILELLVGVAIIAVLAALMTAGWGQFRQRGRTIECISNLRTLHTGILAYAHDHSGDFVIDKSNEATAASWYMGLREYIPNEPRGKRRCPYFCLENPATQGTSRYWTNYMANYAFYSGGTNVGRAPAGEETADFLAGRKGRKLTGVSPQKVLLIESFNGIDSSWHTVSGGNWTDVHAIHDDRVNVLFAGGHVVGVKVSPRIINADRDLNELRREWFLLQ